MVERIVVDVILMYSLLAAVAVAAAAVADWIDLLHYY
jgi:hypothetical protein